MYIFQPHRENIPLTSEYVEALANELEREGK